MEHALQAESVYVSIYLEAGVFWSRNFWIVAYVGAGRQSVLKDLCHQKCYCTHQHINFLLHGIISEPILKKNPWILI